VVAAAQVRERQPAAGDLEARGMQQQLVQAATASSRACPGERSASSQRCDSASGPAAA